MNIEDIARTCHEANRAVCEIHGDRSHFAWDDAPGWQKKAIINGVEFHLKGDYTPEETHDNWMRDKEKDGWVYGKVKDAEKKTHPCLVPYNKLPPHEKAKDAMIAAIVGALKNKLTA